MEARQHQRVLPSNAPTLEHSLCTQSLPTRRISTPHFSGICRDFNVGLECRSCNCHHICSACHQGDHAACECKTSISQACSNNVSPHDLVIPNIEFKDPQYGIKAPSVFADPPIHTAQAAIKREHRRHQQYTSFPLFGERDHCELESGRYKQYREKSRTKQREGKGGPWTDEAEEAFQIAIRLFGGKGRKKDPLDSDTGNKLSGGNEFISRSILLQTGISLGRKVISSHIQTLKPMLKHVPRWMSYVKEIKDEPSARRGKTKTKHLQTSPYDDSAARYARCDMWPSPPTNYLPSNMPRGPATRSIKFSMKLCDKPPEMAEMAVPKQKYCYHTYTSIQSEMGSAPKPFHDLPSWCSMYPHLQPYDEAEVATPIFLFDSGLSLSDRYIPKTVVEIDLRITFTQGAMYRDWQSQTQIYDELASTDKTLKSPIDQINLEDQDLALTLSFRAKYWARLFARFSEAKHVARESGDAANIQQAESFPRRFLSKLFLMQELWATPNVEGAGPQRMAILLWRFYERPEGEIPTTSWRRLIAPMRSTHVEEPDVQRKDTSAMIDPSLQLSFPVQRTSLQPYAEELSQQRTSGFTTAAQDHIDAIQNPLQTESTSPGSEIPTDLGSSFPSATSASFPSSISGSISQAQLSQQGSIDSQGCSDIFTPFESFPSQDPAYIIDARQLDYGSHEAAMIPQADHAYAIDETIYGSQDPTNAFYQGFAEFPAFEAHYNSQQTDEATLIATNQNFAGGGIQLTYEDVPPNLEAQSHPEQSNIISQTEQQEQLQQQQQQHHHTELQDVEYESPLVAPQAHMISQHHILQLQHLEELHENDLSRSPQDKIEPGKETILPSSPPQSAPRNVYTPSQEHQQSSNDHHGRLEAQFEDESDSQYQHEEECIILPPAWDQLQHHFPQPDVSLYEDVHSMVYEGLENWHGEVGPDAFAEDHVADEETVLEVRIKEEGESSRVVDALLPD